MRHLLDVIAERHGGGAVLAFLAVSLLAVGVVAPDGSPAFGIALALAGLAFVTSDVTETTEPTELESERKKYVEGEITLAEFEERAETILDGRRQELRDRVEEINGIGPATSTSIAEEFRSLAELRGAPVSELKKIHGVGDSTAETVVDELGIEPSKEHPAYRDKVEEIGGETA